MSEETIRKFKAVQEQFDEPLSKSLILARAIDVYHQYIHYFLNTSENPIEAVINEREFINKYSGHHNKQKGRVFKSYKSKEARDKMFRHRMFWDSINKLRFQ